MAHREEHTNQAAPFLLSIKKKRKRLLKRMSVLLSLFTAASGVVLYFISPLSDVGMLSVAGNQEVPDQEVVDASGILSGDPLWETYLSKPSIEDRIVDTHPQVQQAEMQWAGINDFEFVISEWQAVAYLFENDQYYRILENGTIMDEPHTVSIGNMPIFRSFEEGEELNRMVAEFSKLDSSIHNLISEIKYSPTETNEMLVHVYMNDGNQVLASIPVFSERMQYYPAMKQSVNGESGLFDLEAGAYFVPFNDKTEETEEGDLSEERRNLEENPDTEE